MAVDWMGRDLDRPIVLDACQSAAFRDLLALAERAVRHKAIADTEDPRVWAERLARDFVAADD